MLVARFNHLKLVVSIWPYILMISRPYAPPLFHLPRLRAKMQDVTNRSSNAPRPPRLGHDGAMLGPKQIEGLGRATRT